MLAECDESLTISLLTDSSQEDAREVSSSSSGFVVKKLRVNISEVSIPSTSLAHSPRRSCAHRALDFVLGLPLENVVGHLIARSDRELLDKIRILSETEPSASRILATLLGRQWPKWHCFSESGLGPSAIQSLTSLGWVLTTRNVSDWEKEMCFPQLPMNHVLGGDLKIHKSANMLDIFLGSLPIEHLKKLVHIPAKQNLSRPALIAKVKTAYNGKQRTIFGGLNDIQLLLNKVKDLDKGGMRLMLTESCKRLFTTLSFILDIDSADEGKWDNSLPSTVLKSMAEKGITTLTPRRLTERSTMNFGVPTQLYIFTSTEQVEATRFLDYLETRVEKRRICPKSVCSNVRSFLRSLDISWDPESGPPEWWWRRQLPRRCSNLIWKCIAELERMKYYDVALDNLKFLLDHNQTLLGRKRRGKVAIRLIIECGHLGIDPDSTFRHQLESIDLFPADVAEISRKLSGMSLKKFDWPCGPVKERTVEIFGAESRDFNWVENAALEEYYLNPQHGGFERGLHCEGRAMMDIFNTLFSDVLGPQNGRPELFQSPIQRWALDLGFLQSDPDRWSQAMVIVEEIASHDFDDLADYFLSKKHHNSDYPLPEILSCMRGSTLAGIMKLIVSDPFYWGGGQPDLLAWDTRTRRMVFSEVKGPGDQLSPRQRWWLMHLEQFGAEAEVCYVVDERNVKNRKQQSQIQPKTEPKIELIELD